MFTDPVSDGSFRLDFDQATRLAVFQPIGHWTHETVDRWLDAFRALIQQHCSGAPPVRLLVNLRERQPHCRVVAARIQASISSLSIHFERVAVVLPRSALTALQARRLSESTDRADQRQRLFAPDELDGAVKWITEQPYAGLAALEAAALA